MRKLLPARSAPCRLLRSASMAHLIRWHPHEEQVLQLSAALDQLPEAQREALILRHFHGQSLAQIAQQLDRSHAAVAGLLKRGLHQLRERLQD